MRLLPSPLVLAAILSPLAPTAADDTPWPAPVPGYQPVQPGEHPRLLFRESDLPALRERARTPEGRAILERLKITLDGGDGSTLPKNLGMKGKPDKDGSGEFANGPAGSVYTISHVAGYGFLYQITQDQRYADLGRKAMDAALEGYRGRDRRYAFRDPYGALRAGPSLGWYALGYDLCYDGWDEEYRLMIAGEIANYLVVGKQKIDLEYLVKGKRHFPASNHWGMQVGGGALATLAIMNDPGVDGDKIAKLLKESEKAMIRNVTEGFGDGGYFAEGDGTGSMASHIVYLSAIQAWNVAGGKDFVTPRPNVRWTALKWFLLTVPDKDAMGAPGRGFVGRGGYPHNIWARADGVSGAGYFSIGYASVLPKERLGIWGWYHQYAKDWDEKNRVPWDTMSSYPHHSVLAFVNTPFGEEPLDPNLALAKNVRDSKFGFYGFRNRWKDRDDVVITQLTRKAPARFRHGPDRNMIIQQSGRIHKWGSIPGKADTWLPAADGSAIIGDGKTWVGIDFSGASGADAMLVMTGTGTPKDDTIEAGGHTYAFKFFGGSPAKPEVRGDTIVIGDQAIGMGEGRLVLSKMAAAD